MPDKDGDAMVALPEDARDVTMVAVSVEPEGGSKSTYIQADGRCRIELGAVSRAAYRRIRTQARKNTRNARALR